MSDTYNLGRGLIMLDQKTAYIWRKTHEFMKNGGHFLSDPLGWMPKKYMDKYGLNDDEENEEND